MRFPSVRTTNLFVFLACVLFLLASFYFEYVKAMQPCLLCILQRWAIGLLGLVFLLAALHQPKRTSTQIYGFVALVVALSGVAAAARQAWLQHQPPQPTETCLPGLNFLLRTHSFPQVVKLMFVGGRDCAEVTWQFLNLTMAEWTLIIFIIFAGIALLQIKRATHLQK